MGSKPKYLKLNLEIKRRIPYLKPIMWHQRLLPIYIGLILAFPLLSGCGNSDSQTPQRVAVVIRDYTHQYLPGSETEIPVEVISMGTKNWEGPVSLMIKKGDSIIAEEVMETKVLADSQAIVNIPLVLPDSLGTYEIVAKIIQPNGDPFLNRRLIEIVSKIRKPII